MNKTQIAETLAGAKCFCGYTKSQHAGVQGYLLALIAGVSTDAQYLVSQSACFSCIHPQIQDGAFAYLMQQFTGVTGTPQQVISSSPCSSCVPQSQQESLKTYLLYLIAHQEAGVTATPTELLNLASQFINLIPVQQYAVLTYVAQQAGGGGGPPVPPFDPTLCITTLAGGGGDSFDCYTVESSITSLPDAGTAFSGLWFIGDPITAYSYGETFNGYPVGAAGTLDQGTGFSGSWIYAENELFTRTDNFDTYTVASPTTETLNAGTGFSGSWAYGDAAYAFSYGETFNGYPVGAAGTLDQGTGLSGSWIYGDSEYFTRTDSFDTYTVASPTTENLNAGTGFTGSWIYGDAAYAFSYGDDFNSYTVGAAGVLSGGTGFSADWIYA